VNERVISLKTKLAEKFPTLGKYFISFLDIIGNNLRAPFRRFTSSGLKGWQKPSGRFLLLPIKSFE